MNTITTTYSFEAEFPLGKCKALRNIVVNSIKLDRLLLGIIAWHVSDCLICQENVRGKATEATIKKLRKGKR
jgi:hypothetical protein